MRVLDLFSGLGGFSQAFKDRGHLVYTVEINPDLPADMHADISELEPAELIFPDGPWDIILASPPCTCFSIASCSTHWWPPGNGWSQTKFGPMGQQGRIPKTQAAADSLDLVIHTLFLINVHRPRFWVMENPRGILRKLIHPPTQTVTYCRFGDTAMKPTDLWGNLPPVDWSDKMCHNGNPDHIRAPRGSETPGSTQGRKGNQLRGKVPYGLSLALCLAAEESANRAGGSQ